MTKEAKDKLHERQIQHAMGTCVHFRGIQHELCGAGVNLRQLVGGADLGWAIRIPCMLADAENCTTPCDKRIFPTRAEAEAKEKEHEERMEKFLGAAKFAHAHAKAAGLRQGNGGRGEMPCPTECGGTLRYSVAGVNGHMHAACSTKGCVSWME